MRILAIDPGFSCGYALMGAEKVLSGSHAIPGDGQEQLGLALYAMREWLLDLMRRTKPDVVAIATSFISPKATPDSLEPLFAMIGVVNMCAHDYSTRCIKISEGKARRSLVGKGLPNKSKLIKIAVMAACRNRGWPTTDNHAADALCVAAHALEILLPERAHTTTPLFSGETICPKALPRGTTSRSRTSRNTGRKPAAR